jgi:ElaB/YqjD/DUF883 family membrane-anchored ribosome-binding protein
MGMIARPLAGARRRLRGAHLAGYSTDGCAQAACGPPLDARQWIAYANCRGAPLSAASAPGHAGHRHVDSTHGEPIMADGISKLESSGAARVQDARDRTQDYLDLAAQTATSGMDRIAERARKGVDVAADSAKAGLEWASDKASGLRDRNMALVHALTDSVAARPLVAIGIAAGLGYIIGRIMRRTD